MQPGKPPSWHHPALSRDLMRAVRQHDAGRPTHHPRRGIATSKQGSI
jgi:hypothetical protein